MQQLLQIIKDDRLEEQEGGIIAFNGSPDQLLALLIQDCIEAAQRERKPYGE